MPILKERYSSHYILYKRWKNWFKMFPATNSWMARVPSRIYIWNTGSHHGNSVTRSSVPSLKLARSMVRTKANLALVLPCFISKFEVGGNLAVRRPPGWFRLWQIIFCDSTLWCAGVSPTIPSHPFGHPGEWGLSYPVSLALRQGRTVKTFFLFLLPPLSRLATCSSLIL